MSENWRVWLPFWPNSTKPFDYWFRIWMHSITGPVFKCSFHLIFRIEKVMCLNGSSIWMFGTWIPTVSENQKNLVLNGRFLQEPPILILSHFWPPSCFSHLKSGQNRPVLKCPFKNRTIFFRFGHCYSYKTDLLKPNHLNTGTKNSQLILTICILESSVFGCCLYLNS
jgi:hypothetical protein